jgi:arsenite methyltransferase
VTVVGDRWSRWLLETRHGGDDAALAKVLETLAPIRDRVLADAGIREGETVLDVGCGDGLIAFGALNLVGSGGRVIFSDVSQDLLDRCAEAAAGDERCTFLLADATDLADVADATIDAVTLRSVLIYVADRASAFAEFHRVLRPGGRLSLFEPLNSFGYPGPDERWGPWDVAPVRDLAERVKDVFRAVHAGTGDTMHDFHAKDMTAWAMDAGFRDVRVEATYQLRPPLPLESWEAYERVAANPLVHSLREAIDSALDAEEADRFRAQLRAQAEAGDGIERTAHAFLRAVK